MTRTTPADELRAAMMLAEVAPKLLRERDALRDVLQAAIDQQKVLHEFLTKGAFAQVAELTRERDALRAEVAALKFAAADALSGWRYIRNVHGDLGGVGWDRVEAGLAAVLDGYDYRAALFAALAGAAP